MKKTVSLLLALALALSLATVAFAADRTEAEPNNRRSDAGSAYAGDVLKGTISSASDIDCWKITPSESGSLSVSLTGPTGYFYNLWLQDSNGDALAKATNLSTSKTISYNVTAGTSYYIVVNKSSKSDFSDSKSYTVSVGTINTASKAVDESEPNDRRVTADAIGFGASKTGYMNSSSDIDCWKLAPDKSGKVTINLSGPTGKDYDIWLQDANGAALAKSRGKTCDETISYNVVSGATYYVVVVSYSGSSVESPYTLKVGNIG